MNEDLAARYRKLPDERLLELAIYEAGDLTPEAVEVLQVELDTRSLHPGLQAIVEAQTRELSLQEVDVLIRGIRAQPCPECGRREHPLNAGIVADAKSFVLFSTYDAPTIIACPNCLARRSWRAVAITSLLGWWGIPWGPIYSIRALYHDAKTLSAAKRPLPSRPFYDFVVANPGLATALASGHAPPS